MRETTWLWNGVLRKNRLLRPRKPRLPQRPANLATPRGVAGSERRRIQMRPPIPLRKFDLVEPIGIGTGLVEASSSLWKRAAERSSVSFGDFVRWAFDEQRLIFDYPHEVNGRLALQRRFLGIDGLTAVAGVYLVPLRSLVASDHIEACTLRPFTGLLCVKNLLRRHRTWCPLCFVSMKSEPGVYEPLIWRLHDVTVCPMHKVGLVQVCHVCLAPKQDVFSPFGRVGCCNRCGAWLGTEDTIRELRRAGEFDIEISRIIMDLLAETSEFDSHGIDGRLTFRKMVASNRLRDLLALTLDVPPEEITQLASRLQLPSLATLAAVAYAARQPLHRVILGQLVPWGGTSVSSDYKLKRRPHKNWIALERKFDELANGPTFVNLRDACKQLDISMGSARIHFPMLVARIVQRGKELRIERAVARRRELSIRVRNAFRMLIAANVYPSYTQLHRVSGVNYRKLVANYKDLLDKEWIRAGRITSCRRRRVSKPSVKWI